MIARRPLIFADGHVEWRQVEIDARFIKILAEPLPRVDVLRTDAYLSKVWMPVRMFEWKRFRTESGAEAEVFVETGATQEVAVRAFVDLVIPILGIAPQRG